MDGDGVPRSRIARRLKIGKTPSPCADMPGRSPRPPLVGERPPDTDGLSLDGARSQADLSVRASMRHGQEVYDRAADEMGYEGSYSSIRRYVAAQRASTLQGPRDGYLELEWAPGTTPGRLQTSGRRSHGSRST